MAPLSLNSLPIARTSPRVPGSRVEEAREHLERGGLARAVRSEEPDPLARRDLEGHVVHRAHRLHAAAHERPQRGPKPGIAPVDAVLLDQVLDGDHACTSST